MAEQRNVEQVKEGKVVKKKIRTRTIIVLASLIVFLITFLINSRAEYLELLEIGENYTEVFYQNIKYNSFISIANFVFIFLTVCITNIFIRKGLRKFFEDEKINMPKLPSKSIALIFALIAAMSTPNIFLEKVILFRNSAQFGIPDPIFNFDIGFYMTQAPLIGLLLYYFLTITIVLTIYIAIYYIITLNVYFDGVDGQTLKNNTFIKHLLFNAMVITILIVGIMLFNTQHIILDNFITINNEEETSIVGAGTIESTIKIWGYRILGIVIIISVYMAIRYFKKSSARNVIKSLAVVPMYLVGLFLVMVGYQIFFINGNELDKEKSYISTNIEYTKTAYDVKVDEIDLESASTITSEEATKNAEVIDNIPVITDKVALNNLEQTQTSTGYYTYSNAKATIYDDRLTYVAAREISNENTTYNSKADEYTHGYGAVLVSANETDENGNVVYVSKDFDSTEIAEPRIYYGTETNRTLILSDDTLEFDYPKTTTQNAVNSYDGERRNNTRIFG